MSDNQPLNASSQDRENALYNSFFQQTSIVQSELKNTVGAGDYENSKILGLSFCRSIDYMSHYKLQEYAQKAQIEDLQAANACIGRAYFDAMDMIISRKKREIEQLEMRLDKQHHRLAKEMGEDVYCDTFYCIIELRKKLNGWDNNTSPANRKADYSDLEAALKKEEEKGAIRACIYAADSAGIPKVKEDARQRSFETEYTKEKGEAAGSHTKNKEASRADSTETTGQNAEWYSSANDEEREVRKLIHDYHNLAAATLKTWELTNEALSQDGIATIAEAALQLYTGLQTKDSQQRLTMLKTCLQKFMNVCLTFQIDLHASLEKMLIAINQYIPHYKRYLETFLAKKEIDKMSAEMEKATGAYNRAINLSNADKDTISEMSEVIALLQNHIIFYWKYQHIIDKIVAQNDSQKNSPKYTELLRYRLPEI